MSFRIQESNGIVDIQAEKTEALIPTKKYYAVVDFSKSPLTKLTGRAENVNPVVNGVAEGAIASPVFPFVSNPSVSVSALFALDKCQSLWWDGNTNSPIVNGGEQYAIQLNLFDEDGNKVDYIPKNRAINNVESQQLDHVVATGDGSQMSRSQTTYPIVDSAVTNSPVNQNLFAYACVASLTDSISLLSYKVMNTSYYGTLGVSYMCHKIVPLCPSLRNIGTIYPWLGDYGEESLEAKYDPARIYNGMYYSPYSYIYSINNISNIPEVYADSTLQPTIINKPTGTRILSNSNDQHPTHVNDSNGNMVGYRPVIAIMSNISGGFNFPPTGGLYTGAETDPTLRAYSLTQGKIGIVITTVNSDAYSTNFSNIMSQ
jgi:hypothetical protein